MSDERDVQLVEGATGEPAFAVIPIADYRAMQRDLEAFADIKAGRRELTGLDLGAKLVPAEVAHRIAEGENPVRVWREHRGLKAVELARAAGISPAYLSEIETGKKEGTFRTMAALAARLDISLDDLAPLPDEADAEQHKRTGRENAIKAGINAIRAIIASGAFDTGAVRTAAERLSRDAEQLIASGDDAGGWATALRSAVERIFTLVDQAESEIIGTATTTQTKLEEIMKLDAFATGRAARRGAAASGGVPETAGEAEGTATPETPRSATA